MGSSPRMRGKQTGVGALDEYLRLIPAHAGKTWGRIGGFFVLTAHPRACGENFYDIQPGDVLCGSSPRMRGKPHNHLQTALIYGLIPAHAGKTVTMICGSIAIRAHPRACGENFEWENYWRDQRGSSPRMRGKHQCR